VRCIPCEREKKKLPFLLDKAKQRAIENKTYLAVYFDKEDKKYRITTETLAKRQGEEILQVLSPY